MKTQEKKLTPEQIKKLQEEKKNKALTGQIVTKDDRDTTKKGKGAV